jgi:PHD/YefM family antitoxin component YafN of YafNO toxin-antitoxin module
MHVGAEQYASACSVQIWTEKAGTQIRAADARGRGMSNRQKSTLGSLFEKIQTELDELYGKYVSVNKMTARQKFAEVTNAVGFHKQRVVITNREDPFVLLAPVEDLKKLHMLDEAGITDVDNLRKVLNDYKKAKPKDKRAA